MVVLASAALMGLLSLTKQIPPPIVVAGVTATVLEGFLVTGIIRAMNPNSIATPRRLFGLFLVSTLLWIVPLLIGVIATAFGLTNAIINEFVLGAFLVWGFETIVINGAFVKSSLTSLGVAALHPVPILLITLFAVGHAYLYATLTGILALALLVLFLLGLKRVKTARGTSSLQLLQAFLNTWVGQSPHELEGYFSSYAETQQVVTDVIVAEDRHEKVAFVLPGVHPGPFFPVGSYNLSELIHGDLSKEGVHSAVLHGTGGHERNAPTNAQAVSYAAEISKFVASLNASQKGTIRGPVHDRVGITNITTMAFGKAIISTISNSPFFSDDLDPKSSTEASEVAAGLGFTLSMVDAHNSIDGENRPQTPITRESWEGIFTRLLALPERDVKVGFASSVDEDFKLGPDVSEGGISIAILATQDSKNALVMADSNNAVSSLREGIVEELRKTGLDLIELCTSDTHNSAARGLVNRGYLALGEGTGTGPVIDAVGKLARTAESRVFPCNLAFGRFETVIPLIGTKSLDDFARLATEATSYAKTYSKVVGLVILALIAITLFY